MKSFIAAIFVFTCSTLLSVENYYFNVSGLSKTGFFSNFYLVLAVLDAYEQYKLPFKIQFTKGLYTDPLCKEKNWWLSFFQPLQCSIASNAIPLYHYTSAAQGSYYAKYKLSNERKNYLINKYIRLNPNIQKKFDNLKKHLFQDFYIVGVHYRGTDRKPPAWYIDSIFEALDHFQNEHKNLNYKIFVATDEEKILKDIQKHYPNKVVYCDHIRSKNSAPLHKNNNNNYLAGEQALLDCLLLAHSDYLIRSYSNLSEIAECWVPCPKVINIHPERPLEIAENRICKTNPFNISYLKKINQNKKRSKP